MPVQQQFQQPQFGAPMAGGFPPFNAPQPAFQPQANTAPVAAPATAGAAASNPFAAAASANPFGGGAIKEFKPKDPRAIMDDDDDTPLGFDDF